MSLWISIEFLNSLEIRFKHIYCVCKIWGSGWNAHCSTDCQFGIEQTLPKKCKCRIIDISFTLLQIVTMSSTWIQLLFLCKFGWYGRIWLLYLSFLELVSPILRIAIADLGDSYYHPMLVLYWNNLSELPKLSLSHCHCYSFEQKKLQSLRYTIFDSSSSKFIVITSTKDKQRSSNRCQLAPALSSIHCCNWTALMKYVRQKNIMNRVVMHCVLRPNKEHIQDEYMRHVTKWTMKMGMLPKRDAAELVSDIERCCNFVILTLNAHLHRSVINKWPSSSS